MFVDSSFVAGNVTLQDALFSHYHINYITTVVMLQEQFFTFPLYPFSLRVSEKMRGRGAIVVVFFPLTKKAL